MALGRRLFEGIDHARSAGGYATVGAELDEAKAELDQRCGGLGTELWLWLGLKQDSKTEMAQNYRATLIKSFPELVTT